MVSSHQRKASDARVPNRTIRRLSVYHRTLTGLPDRAAFIFSHELARLCGASAAQVRRDLMVVATSGSSSRGYRIADLIAHIDEFFAPVERHRVALVGVGTLGRTLIAYFRRRYHRLSIVAVFDRDPELTGRVVHGVRSYPMTELHGVIAEQGISIAILALPDNSAQEVTDQLVVAGVSGILNFAPVSLRVPEGTLVEDIDITAALDKLAFHAPPGRRQIQER